jgi:hypothetical protein
VSYRCLCLRATPLPAVLNGQVATEMYIGLSVLFIGEMDSGHCDAMLAAEEIE